MTPHFENLVNAVQTNCDIADARHARDLTLCTYLLEMREFYRWEHGKPFSETLARAEVGKWIARRETLWGTLEDADFVPLSLKELDFDPFDAAAVNEVLVPDGLVYGAGIGRFGKPQFFLGELKSELHRDNARILISGREYARDLSPPPAALRHNTIYLRQESFQRWLWEKIETWGVRKPGGALKETLDAYGFSRDSEQALQRMTDMESETLILHELGELEAGRLLGETWNGMRASQRSRRAELFVRAARDNLADCLVTLPKLLEREATASIHFWFANFDGMRREIFPRLAHSYDGWDGCNMAWLSGAVREGRDHWDVICQQVLDLHRGHDDADAAIEGLSTAPNVYL